MRNRIKYSQNFLINQKLVSELVNKSEIYSGDMVIEIGAGEGIITEELIKKSKNVIAYEIDSNLFHRLNIKFPTNTSVKLLNDNFLQSNLPTSPYKIFSNIPFNVTGDVVKKLLFADNKPVITYLILQKESAQKFAGRSLCPTNSQMSVILYPWFEFKILYEFNSSDFFPKPNVDIVLLEIRKREKPFIEYKIKYQDFITYIFNQPKPNITESLSKIMKIKLTKLKPSELEFEDYLDLFNLFLDIPQENQNIVKGYFTKQLKDQENIVKIHRTRTDKNWRKY